MTKKRIIGAFVEQEGNIVRIGEDKYRAFLKGLRYTREQYEAMKQKNFGKAYAFFDCDASKEELQNALPDAREKAQTPSNLEILLHEGIEGLVIDDDLEKKLQYPDDYRIMSEERMKQGYEEERQPLKSLKYVLIGISPTQTNEQVAGEIGDIVNYISNYNKDQDIFRGAITYEKDGEYILKE